jgi:peptide/nickel transport system substrate-binding protein
VGAAFVLRSVLVVAVLLAGGGAMGQPREAVRIGVLAPRGLGTLDPHFATAHFDRMAASWTHGALVRFKPGSISPADIEPDLAARWEVSADALVWTFFLRPGVLFHQGFGPVTADDVVFSLRKAADAQRSAYAGDFAAVRSIEAVDPATVRVTLKQPVPSLLGLLANYSGGFILSRRAMEGGGAAAAAVGFGPFALADRGAGQSAEFVADDAYFRGRPQLRRIVYQFVGSLAASDLAFNAGELDVIEGQQDQAWIERMRRLPGTAVDVIEPAEISWLHLNVSQAPLDDPRVRRAVALAVNRTELAAWRGGDLAQAARSVIPVRYLGFADGVVLPATDVARARQLLAEAGYPEGVTIRTIHTSNPVMLSAIQVVQAQLRRAGINLDVQVVDHLTYNQMIRKDLSPLVHYAAARFPVADVMLTQFFHSRSTVGTPGGVTNFSHCAAGDAAIDAARVEPGDIRRIALWGEAQRAIVAADCAVPLLETRQVWARRASFDYGFDFKGAMSTGPLLTETAHFVP